MAFVIVTMFIQVILFSARWRLLVLQCGAAMRLTNAVRYGLISMFFNQTLPSTVGGDGARIWLLARDGAGWKIATYSVLGDRAVGILALAILVTLCLPWTLTLVQDPVGRVALCIIAGSSLTATLSFLAMGIVRWNWLNRFWGVRHLAAVAAIVDQALREPRRGLQIAALSIAIHLLTVIAAWSAARAAAASFDFTDALLLVLPVILVATIPISIAGWGVRESTMVAAFAYSGLAEADGLIVSILFGAATFAVGIVGGIIWIVGAHQADKKMEDVQNASR
jgi:uncharacterized membrane protein YbhN (UPF0104 family)